jgi:histone H4
MFEVFGLESADGDAHVCLFLECAVCDVVTYTEHARRKTVTAMNAVYALKGCTLNGVGG